MNDLWNSKQAQEATQGVFQNTKNWQANKVIIDSRSTSQNSLFIALKGENTDGHNFIDDAFKAGASCAIVSAVPAYAPANFPLLITANTKDALNALGAYRRAEVNAKIIAVTGSVGKTSTKEQLNIAFSSLGSTFSSYGNYNNELGVPLSLANMPRDTKFGIFEIGMNHLGEITPLTKLVRPDVAIITSIEAAHLQFFESVEQIADAKAEIFQGLAKNGFAILNCDNPYFSYLSSIASKQGITNIISFGQKDGANSRLISYNEKEDGSLVEADILGKVIKYKLKSFGLHLAKNSLATLSAVAALGADIETAARALSEFSALKGRGKQHLVTLNKKQFLIIDDSYNASPASIKAALKVLSSNKRAGRKIAILADMRELGQDSIKMHTSLAAEIKENKIDKVITVGENMEHLFYALNSQQKLAHYSDVSKLIEDIQKYIEDNDTILVKGSLGTAIYKLVETLVA